MQEEQHHYRSSEGNIPAHGVLFSEFWYFWPSADRASESPRMRRYKPWTALFISTSIIWKDKFFLTSVIQQDEFILTFNIGRDKFILHFRFGKDEFILTSVTHKDELILTSIIRKDEFILTSIIRKDEFILTSIIRKDECILTCIIRKDGFIHSFINFINFRHSQRWINLNFYTVNANEYGLSNRHNRHEKLKTG